LKFVEISYPQNHNIFIIKIINHFRNNKREGEKGRGSGNRDKGEGKIKGKGKRE
jgi:hypothetical protein